MPDDYIAPLAASELDVRRMLATIAALTHSEGVYRDAVRAALEQLHDNARTIKSLREQLAASRAEVRAAR